MTAFQGLMIRKIYRLLNTVFKAKNMQLNHSPDKNKATTAATLQLTVTLPSTTQDIGELDSVQCAKRELKLCSAKDPCKPTCPTRNFLPCMATMIKRAILYSYLD